jgi:hypothetical protein
MASIKWNPQVKLILSDVDETIADLYLPTDAQLILELERILREGITLFLISGQGERGIRKRITDKIYKGFKKNILISHCSGSEVWGFDKRGNLRKKPFYSLYDEKLDKKQKRIFRKVIKELIKEFELKVFDTMPVLEFLKYSKNDPLKIMMQDRGPQITFEVVNGTDLNKKQVKALNKKIPLTHGHYDLRIPIFERSEDLFKKYGLPISARLGGMFAIDFAVQGVSKETSVIYVLNKSEILRSVGLSKNSLDDPKSLEIWGDKFSEIRGGTDRHMSEAVDKRVRAIDFRKENPKEFPNGYNIVVWDGKKNLHNGLLEYLQTR